MAMAKQYEYSPRELVALMIRDQGIKEGHWILGMSYHFGAMNMGANPDGRDAAPTTIATVSSVIIERVPEPLPFSVDAAKLSLPN